MLRSAVFCWAALCCVLLCGAVLCRFNMLACCGQGGVLTNSIFFARGKSPSICLAARRDQEVCTLPVVELIQRSWCDPGHASLQPQPWTNGGRKIEFQIDLIVAIQMLRSRFFRQNPKKVMAHNMRASNVLTQHLIRFLGQPPRHCQQMFGVHMFWFRVLQVAWCLSCFSMKNNQLTKRGVTNRNSLLVPNLALDCRLRVAQSLSTYPRMNFQWMRMLFKRRMRDARVWVVILVCVRAHFKLICCSLNHVLNMEFRIMNKLGLI